MTVWDRHARGWACIEANLPYFLPRDPRNHDDLKQIGELALIHALVTKWRHDRELTSNGAVDSFLREWLAKPHAIEQARRRPGYFVATVFPYLCFRSIGNRIVEWEAVLPLIARSGYPAACERVPYRQLEIKYMLWQAGLALEEPNWASATRLTTLAQIANPAYLVDWEVYSVTHTVFYLTDFGYRPCRSSCDPSCGPLESILDALLVRYWRQANWDIVGELLICLHPVRHRSRIFPAALAAFLQVWRDDGYMPGPYFKPNTHCSGMDIFDRCYHTTLVGLILLELIIAAEDTHAPTS